MTGGRRTDPGRGFIVDVGSCVKKESYGPMGVIPGSSMDYMRARGIAPKNGRSNGKGRYIGIYIRFFKERSRSKGLGV